jgi:SAM-dependent methyltransferase
MSDWQERITRETAPAIRVEHELRYRIAAPLIKSSAAWCDLGCGNGVAAAAALDGWHPQRTVLVDIEPSAIEQATRELGAPDSVGLSCDLTDRQELERIGDALLSVEGERVVSCFEVIEHLSSFVALIEWAGELARTGQATFVISVPNDAFWSIQNPHHLSAWGEGAFEELHRLLPTERTLLRQVALSGSAVIGWEGTPEQHELAASIGGRETVASHFIAAFGPSHGRVWHGALAAQTDVLDQRRWERQRESDLARTQHVEQELRAELQQRVTWFEEWRAYIHQLERELGKPLSGVSPEDLPTSSEAE